MHFQKKKCVCVCVRAHMCLCALVFFVCWRSTLDPTAGRLFVLLCTKFPSRPQSFLSENDSGPSRRGRVVITCDITTLISSLVIVKSLWVEGLNNGKECEMRVCVCVAVWRRQPTVSRWSSLISPKFLHCLRGVVGAGIPQICFLRVLKSWLDDNLFVIIAILLAHLIWLMDSLWRE